MKTKRKIAYKQDVEAKNAEHERFRASSNPTKAYVPSEFFGKNKYTNIQQKKDEERIAARRAVNLTDEMQDVKRTRREPTLDYVSAPKVMSKSILDQNRKQEMLNDLKKIEKNFE